MAVNDNTHAEIFKAVSDIISTSSSHEEKLKQTCECLAEKIEHYDWVGFYLVDKNSPNELILGPYVGATTDHTRIKFGQGICGQAADSGETFIVDDISKETNYLSCSIHVKSEIVLPVFHNKILVGELDIDSHTISAFDKSDEKLLNEICKLVSAYL